MSTAERGAAGEPRRPGGRTTGWPSCGGRAGPRSKRSSPAPEGSAASLTLLEDERRFIDLAASPLFVCEEHPVIERVSRWWPPAQQARRAPRPPGSDGGGRRASAALLAAVTVVYLPSLLNGLVWDDLLQIAANPRLQSLAAARSYFGALEGPYYRPLVFVSYAVEHRLWGAGAFGAHVINLALHLLNTGLVVTLARRGGVAPAAALLGGAIFALHPLQSEAVAYVSGRTDLLMTSGALLSWLALGGGGSAWRRGLGAAAAGGIAMLSKESGFALLLLWPWWAWRRERGTVARLLVLAPGLALAALLLLARPGCLAEPRRRR